MLPDTVYGMRIWNHKNWRKREIMEDIQCLVELEYNKPLDIAGQSQICKEIGNRDDSNVTSLWHMALLFSSRARGRERRCYPPSAGRRP